MTEPAVDFLSGDYPLQPVAAAFLAALLRSDRRAASQLVFEALDAGAPLQSVYLDVFQRVQWEVGRLWELSRITIAQEHLCTAATQLVISQLYPRLFDGLRNGRSLVASCVAGTSTSSASAWSPTSSNSKAGRATTSGPTRRTPTSRPWCGDDGPTSSPSRRRWTIRWTRSPPWWRASAPPTTSAGSSCSWEGGPSTGSPPGDGSTFSVRLPRAQGAPDSAPAAAPV